MLDSFRSRIAAARKSNELFFAALIPVERIVSIFGKASAILDSASVYTTAVTAWTLLSQVLSEDHSCVNAVAKLIAFRDSKINGSRRPRQVRIASHVISSTSRACISLCAKPENRSKIRHLTPGDGWAIVSSLEMEQR